MPTEWNDYRWGHLIDPSAWYLTNNTIIRPGGIVMPTEDAPDNIFLDEAAEVDHRVFANVIREREEEVERPLEEADEVAFEHPPQPDRADMAPEEARRVVDDALQNMQDIRRNLWESGIACLSKDLVIDYLWKILDNGYRLERGVFRTQPQLMEFTEPRRGRTRVTVGGGGGTTTTNEGTPGWVTNTVDESSDLTQESLQRAYDQMTDPNRMPLPDVGNDRYWEERHNAIDHQATQRMQAGDTTRRVVDWREHAHHRVNEERAQRAQGEENARDLGRQTRDVQETNAVEAFGTDSDSV